MKCTKCKNGIHGLFIGFNRPFENRQILLCVKCCRNYTKDSKEQIFLFMDAFIYWLQLNENLIAQFNISDCKPNNDRDTGTN